MKAKFISLFFITFLIQGVKAQRINHCKTHDKLMELQKAEPSTEARALNAEQKIQDWISANKNLKANSIIVVPVVVHVLYKNAVQNIPDARIQLQIDILNIDYRKLNSDTASTPAAFKPLAADCEIEFCLASRDPFGNPTNGITRKSVSVSEIGNTNKFYQSNLGGEDIWDRNFYLNIWVCEIESTGGTLGYSTVPSFNPSPARDGVVIDYRYFGTSTNSHYNKGRTATHEIGHWFDLLHTWGDDGGACWGDDLVADTPNQYLEHYGLPAFPSLDSCSSSSPGTMFMDYMDYTDDNGMNMFSLGQKQRMWAALMTTFRDSLFHSQGCVPVGIEEAFANKEIKIVPNPSNGKFFLSFNLREAKDNQIMIYDLMGNLVFQKALNTDQKQSEEVDLSGYSNGLYLLKINSGTNYITGKIIKE